jgi:hypothetical protein
MIVQLCYYGGFVLAYPFNFWMVLIAAGFPKAQVVETGKGFCALSTKP